MKMKVPVRFDGVVEVEVDDSLDRTERRILAKNLAMARILAVTDNPDAPEDDAFEEFKDRTGMIREDAEKAWDSAKIIGVGGEWVSE